ncbi:MAG: high-affinity branched-chain amino acid transporter permease, partial [Deltaproteobacteria bacterium]|nr:high-affinity branched-chain amino acid transporter permease [Deltaproteobacteria bacterium]
MLRPVLVALWLSLLFLPFKGLKASLILFVILSCSFILFRYLGASLRSLRATMQPLGNRVYTKGIALSRLRGSRYVVLLILLGLPFFLENYILDISILTGIYAILAMGLNVVVGFAGLLNLGYVAFYAIGAYTYALLYAKIGLGFWVSLPLCIGLTTLSG